MQDRVPQRGAHAGGGAHVYGLEEPLRGVETLRADEHVHRMSPLVRIGGVGMCARLGFVPAEELEDAFPSWDGAEGFHGMSSSGASGQSGYQPPRSCADALGQYEGGPALSHPRVQRETAHERTQRQTELSVLQQRV